MIINLDARNPVSENYYQDHQNHKVRDTLSEHDRDFIFILSWIGNF